MDISYVYVMKKCQWFIKFFSRHFLKRQNFSVLIIQTGKDHFLLLNMQNYTF